MRAFHTFGMVLALAISAPWVVGCAAIAAVLPIVASALDLIADFTRTLDLIAARAKGTPAEEDILRAVGIAKNSLLAAQSIINGAEHMTKDEVKLAFAEFETAYQALYSLLIRADLVAGEGALLGGPVSPIDTPVRVSLKVERLAE